MSAIKILVLDNIWSQTGLLLVELAKKGFDVVLLSPGVPSPEGLGRYCREIKAPDFEAGEPTPVFGQFLANLLARERFDIILPTCEPLQRVAWDLPPEYAAKVFPQAQRWQREILDDRRLMYDLVRSLGVPTPQEVAVASEESLAAVAADLGFPFVLRGTQGLGGQQVFVVNDLEAARSGYLALLLCSPQPPFAQQFIRGTRCGVGCLLDAGKSLQYFAFRSVETYPATTGPSIRMDSLNDPVLIDYATKVFAALKWDGLALAEFMVDENGTYYFLEINPRPWGSIQASRRVGINFFDLFVRYLRGERSFRQVLFKSGVRSTFFPQFLAARIQQKAIFPVKDWKAYCQMLAACPWGALSLLLYYWKRLLWLYRAMKKSGVAST